MLTQSPPVRTAAGPLAPVMAMGVEKHWQQERDDNEWQRHRLSTRCGLSACLPTCRCCLPPCLRCCINGHLQSRECLSIELGYVRRLSLKRTLSSAGLFSDRLIPQGDRTDQMMTEQAGGPCLDQWGGYMGGGAQSPVRPCLPPIAAWPHPLNHPQGMSRGLWKSMRSGRIH